MGTHDGKEKKQAKRKHAVDFMKKMLQNLHYKSKSSTTAHSKGNVNGSVSSKRKLPQVSTDFKVRSYKKKLLFKIMLIGKACNQSYALLESHVMCIL